jgi:sugar transferase (PEP-CTERM system associated)
MQVFNRHVSGRGLTVFGFETLIISGSIVAAGALVHGSFDAAVHGAWKILLVTALCELAFYYNDLYDLTLAHTMNEIVVRVLQAASALAIVLALLTTVAPSFMISGGTVLTSLALVLIAVPLWRFAFEGLTHDPHLEERLLIVGTGPQARALAEHIRSQRDFAYRVVGFVDDGQTGGGEDAQVVGVLGDLPGLIASHQVDRVVVSMGDRRGRLPIDELLQVKLSGVDVEDAATIYERITGKILIDDLRPSWIVFSDGFRTSRLTRLLKRVLDLVFAVIGLVVALPVMALVAVAIRADSRGPLLYQQQRVGQHGRVFTLYKFRSMRTDAETGTPIWATDGDSRVTRIGRFLRISRLDELPQLWNVLRGDMSFVGPRPERPYFVEQLAAIIPFYMQRLAVKPGVTGWAQVKYRYGSTVEDAIEKLRYDLYYIKHLSIVFDLTIAIDTVKVILFGKGAK